MKVENSIEEDIKIVDNFVTYFNRNIQKGYKADLTVLGEEIEAIEHILSDYKRVLKENEYMHNELNKQETTINKYAKENEELKILKSAIQTLQNLGIEDGKYIVMSKTDFLNGSCKHLLDDYIPKQEIKDKIEELNRKIDKSIDNSKGGLDEEFIEKAGELLAQKRILQELLESEE